MYKTLIIEDEPVGAQRLRKLLLEIDNSISVIGPLRTVNEIKATLNNNDYDLIISDIRLGKGTVFDAFKEAFPNSPVIFTTAYDEYAIQAFKNNGIDYLLKPIDPEELREAIAKAINISIKNDHTGLKKLVHECSFSVHHHLLIPKGDELILLDASEISYIIKETETRAYLFNGQSFCLPYTLADLEKMLDSNLFFRLNRQYIANRNALKKITLFFNAKLNIKLKNCDDNNIVISKEKVAEFKRWLEK